MPQMVSTQGTGPRIPIPAVLRSDVPGTWAYDTMSHRIRTDILDRVFRENVFAPDVLAALRALDAELEAAGETALTPIPDDGGPDVEHWNSFILADALGNRETWLSAPWAVAEFYFYRRLMACIGYFKEPVDPFVKQKLLGLTSSVTSMETLALRVNVALVQPVEISYEDFECFVLTSLWGNRMDLSLWPVGSKKEAPNDQASAGGFSAVIEAGQKYIISDDSAVLGSYAQSIGKRGARVDIVVDNAGFELFCDLCLADYMSTSGMASEVHIRLKAHPTFVSDAMAKDVGYTVEYLCQAEEHEELRELGKRWGDHITSGRWLLREDYFWVQPSPMWEMPERLAADLSLSSLVFVKGDANYRRLLGDCAWPYDTPFRDVVSYFPAPVCALRTLKAELGCGMERTKTDHIAADDPKWLVSGRYGVVQFLNPGE